MSRAIRSTRTWASRRGSSSSRASTAGNWRARSSTPERARLMPSFDVVSELNTHEVTNAVDQANRELAQRFDFKDTGANFELKELTVVLHAQVDFQLKQMLEILKLRLSKRGI